MTYANDAIYVPASRDDAEIIVVTVMRMRARIKLWP